MKKRTKETILIGIGLVLLSVILHYVHVLIFKDVHHTMIFLVADIAFIPLEVFFTTIVIDKMLERREKEHLLEKLNMLIGLFYTELGTKLLSDIVKGDAHGVMANHRTITADTWCDKSFSKLHEDILQYDYEINIDKINLKDIRNRLDDNKDLLINLISNGNLLEHETFTEMLMTIMHLKEELDTRYCEEIEEYEIKHIEKDLMAVYKYLTIEWAEYMKYLSRNYPSLYCKALINNPFDNRDKRVKDKCFLESIK
ncbi:hypothetical protein [Paraclostridium bifermentans]|uniref:hypothetical protein n=1 Tax=Paraclostridium bifermentans TaxID=1490 RepID=UPI00189EC0BF|nr:hypothetical protein [Paraclostridium bifermentans]